MFTCAAFLLSQVGIADIILQEVGVAVVFLFKLVERKKVPTTIQNILDKDYLLV